MVDQDCLVEIVTGKVIYSVADKVKGWWRWEHNFMFDDMHIQCHQQISFKEILGQKNQGDHIDNTHIRLMIFNV